jgi:hypothetical protein
LIIAYFGSGPLSLDNIKAHEIKPQTWNSFRIDNLK